MDRSTKHALLVGGGIVLGVYALGKLVSYPIPSPRYLGPIDGHPRLANLLNNVVGLAGRAVGNFQDDLQHYASFVHPGTGRHLYEPLSQKPANARALQIVPTTNVRVIDFDGNPGIGKPGTLACLRTLRAALAEAGRGDEDARVVLYRLAEETGWFRYCQGFNCGNHKAFALFASPETILGNPPTVYEARYSQSVSIHLLTDRGVPVSFAAYYNFPSLASYLRFQAEWYTHNNYNGVQDAYRRGDLQGLIDSEAILARHGYSQWAQSWHDEARQRNTTVAEIAVAHHTLECQGYWRIRQGIAGTDWVR